MTLRKNAYCILNIDADFADAPAAAANAFKTTQRKGKGLTFSKSCF